MDEIEHIAIDMDPVGTVEISTEKNAATGEEGQGDTTLQILMEKRLKKLPLQSDHFEDMSIFRVPARFHDTHKDLFEPRMVSIGPYHRGKESLRFMEEQKWLFLRNFLAERPNFGIEVYIQEIRALEDRARRCYSETIDMKSDDFVMMLLLDGCFLLEHFLRSSRRNYSAYCNLGWAVGNLSTDLVLLDNQIPFFVIHKLFAIQNSMTHNCESSRCHLLDLIFKTPLCSGQYITCATGKPPEVPCDLIYHYLHLIYVCMVNGVQMESNLISNFVDRESHYGGRSDATAPTFAAELDMMVQTYAEELCITSGSRDARAISKSMIQNQVVIPCARRLREAGVTFMRKQKPHDRFDISFTNGTMEIPLLSLSYYRKILWANIAAFEQTQIFYTFRRTFVSYLALMDALVNTEADVALLERSGILANSFQVRKMQQISSMI